MKTKLLVVLLIGVIIIGLTGCGISRENAIKSATKLDLYTFRQELSENEKNAKDKYQNKIYEINAGVISVEDNYAKISTTDSALGSSYFKVPFNNEDLKKLKSKTRIKFVGKISSINKENNNYIVNMNSAYYISDITEITGYAGPYVYSFSNTNSCYLKIDPLSDNPTYFKIPNSEGNFRYENCKINGEEIKEDTLMTITGKAEYDTNNSWIITDIESIKK